MNKEASLDIDQKFEAILKLLPKEKRTDLIDAISQHPELAEALVALFDQKKDALAGNDASKLKSALKTEQDLFNQILSN